MRLSSDHVSNNPTHSITKIVALNRAEANEGYFEIPAALSFVIAPLFCTVKRIIEVTYSKDITYIIIDISNVIAITRLACFEKCCRRPPQGGAVSVGLTKSGGKFELSLKVAIFKGF